MKQVFGKKGNVVVNEIPAPSAREGYVVIKLVTSCISPGTEISSIQKSGESLLTKIVREPAKLTKAIQLLTNEGLSSTLSKIESQVSSDAIPLGYSAAGLVVATGPQVKGLTIGDRVAAAGFGHAAHAEVVAVPSNLVINLPQGLDFNQAATVALGSIALHAVRRCEVHLGDYVVVVGAGILGLIAVALLRLSGCRVIAVDLDDTRLSIARQLGALHVINPTMTDPVSLLETITMGRLADTVLFAAATDRSEPLSQAFAMCRRKGKVVLLGVSGMNLHREDMYAKEIDLIISTSYGPGRYDLNYEEKGQDYPYAYVRWTENRNMAEYLHLLAEKKIDLSLIPQESHGLNDISAVLEGYAGSNTKPLLSFINYPNTDVDGIASTVVHHKSAIPILLKKTDYIVRVGIIGCGNFVNAVHLPNLRALKDRFQVRAAADVVGHKAQALAAACGAGYSCTDFERVVSDPEIDLVLVATRHNDHAKLVERALQAGKHVFVEKPLAITNEQLDAINAFFIQHQGTNTPVLMVGYNRRFSRYAELIQQQTEKRVGPLYMIYRINAGYIAEEHWVHEDGGRIIGEACHMIDLMTFLTGAEIVAASFETVDSLGTKYHAADNRTLIMKYSDGSLCHIHYFTMGSKECSKEYLEVHFDDKTILMDDFRTLKGYGLKMPTLKTEKSEKGHQQELIRLHEALVGKNSLWPIDLHDLLQTSRIALSMAQ